ncbi:nicotinate-nucleotide-dimethylbenzimidazole phosphoribosyltransferase /cob(II)yrinic acid a,c-diamide reductase [Streptomyces sp. 840.1]|uniref:nicotinate-nucleotide--dimethylbenzimidazole phosphoribosyltransferase n=1 Tax=Streptomyces sp. 840.1 TaxID=2485152 RepID=UPI000F491C97|nr:nicotinate-nucleotide--dimethylbenzimidazole phosphoribosyltransferase [Streptomyces sp. 840.1]ROQ62824.1 nicotinate-nucleotide-dimethylbenzimidazole phosphoribosyltransferase /cob(II)yrinic acid a,c-diamide reductase [Streptomyces sp. 840.1]
MSDTGQIPGEGLPENAGMVEQPGIPAPDGYTFLDPSEQAPEDDDLLLMPSPQGAWSEPQAALPEQGGYQPRPAGDGSPVQSQGAVPAQGSVQTQGPVRLQEQAQVQVPAYAMQAPAEPLPPAGPGTHESGGRDSGAVDLSAVRIPSPVPAPAQAQVPVAQAPVRRPLHRGPASPEPGYGGTSGGGVVRSLADRGPAGTPQPQAQAPAPAPAPARHAGPATAEPEYFELTAEESAALPGPQLGEIPPQGVNQWAAQSPQQAAAPAVAQEPPAEAETVVPEAAAEPAPAEQPVEPAPAPEPVVAEEPVAVPVVAETPVVSVPAEAVPEQEPAPAPVEPVAGAPAAESPVADVPVAESPVADVPVADVPVAEAPVADVPVAETQVVEAPAAEAAPVDAAPTEAVPAEAAPAEAAPAEGVATAEVAPADPAPVDAPPVEPAQDGASVGGFVAAQGSLPTAPQPAPASVVEQPEEPEGPEAVVEPAPEARAIAIEPVAPEAAEVAEPADAAVAEPAPEAETGPEVIETPDLTDSTEAAPVQAPETGHAVVQPEQAVPQSATEPVQPEAVLPEPVDAVRTEDVPDAPEAPETVEAPGAHDAAEAPEAPEAEETLVTSPPAPGYDDAEREAVLRVMRERRDIRNGFRSDPVPHEVLLRVLEAAHTAPSVGHSQPWDFVVIRSAETRRSMHELAQRQRDAYAKSLPKARAKQFKELKIEAILETPVNIVVTADPTRGGRHTLGRHTQPQMAPYSSALAVENLWLAARAEGLGVGWVSFFDEREMVRSLGLPEHLEVVAYLCVGYVDEFPEEPELMQAGWSKRRPLSWVVHEETYGRRALPGEEPHDLLQETISNIRPLDAKALGEAWERQKRMTKPAGALGMLEIISAQLSGLSRMCPPPIPEPAAVAIFAGDHGVHAQGVTAWPQEVTGQMVANFLGGGAVCNAFAAQVGAEVCVVDVGVASELPATPGLLPRKVRAGTADFTTGPALTREEVLAAIEVGIETARDLVAAGNKGLLTGEMGIANTTASAALICVYTGMDAAEVTGRGTGINDEMHARKVDVVRRALDLHRPDPADPIGVLAAVGGLEHAAMAGFLLGGASLRTPVILDGVSAGAAALVARAIAPEALAACIAGHRSAEPGHVAALNKLGLRPLVDLDLRLGEGTGALLALPIVQSAARAMHEVATFDSAGVTEK